MSIIVSPPSSRMARSNETRVRVDGLSKIIARTLPASGRPGGDGGLVPAARLID